MAPIQVVPERGGTFRSTVVVEAVRSGASRVPLTGQLRDVD